MNHAPVRGEIECECWEYLCVGRALVRVTSRSFPAAAVAATATDIQIFLSTKIFSGEYVCFLNKVQFSTLFP